MRQIAPGGKVVSTAEHAGRDADRFVPPVEEWGDRGRLTRELFAAGGTRTPHPRMRGRESDGVCDGRPERLDRQESGASGRPADSAAPRSLPNCS